MLKDLKWSLDALARYISHKISFKQIYLRPVTIQFFHFLGCFRWCNPTPNQHVHNLFTTKHIPSSSKFQKSTLFPRCLRLLTCFLNGLSGKVPTGRFIPQKKKDGTATGTQESGNLQSKHGEFLIVSPKGSKNDDVSKDFKVSCKKWFPWKLVAACFQVLSILNQWLMAISGTDWLEVPTIYKA